MPEAQKKGSVAALEGKNNMKNHYKVQSGFKFAMPVRRTLNFWVYWLLLMTWLQVYLTTSTLMRCWWSNSGFIFMHARQGLPTELHPSQGETEKFPYWPPTECCQRTTVPSVFLYSLWVCLWSRCPVKVIPPGKKMSMPLGLLFCLLFETGPHQVAHILSFWSVCLLLLK